MWFFDRHPSAPRPRSVRGGGALGLFTALALLFSPALGLATDPPLTQPNTFVYIGTDRQGLNVIEPRPANVPSSYERYFGRPPPASEIHPSGAARYIFATNNYGSLAQPESAVWYAHHVRGGQTVYVVPGQGFVDPRAVGHTLDTPGGGTVVTSQPRIYPVEELTVSPSGQVIQRRYIPDVNPAVVERQNRLLDLARSQLRPPPAPPLRTPFNTPEGVRAGQLVRDLRYTPPPSTASRVVGAATTALNVAMVAQAAYSGVRNTGNLMSAYLDPEGTRALVQSGQLRVYDFVPFVGGNPAAEIVIGVVDPIYNDFANAQGILGTAGAVLMVPVRIVDGVIITPIAGLADLATNGLAHGFAAAGNAFCRLTGLCDPNLCVRGTPGCEGRGGTNGDPHLATFDGHFYDLQAVGELVLATDGDDFMVQVRQQPWGSSTLVSVNTAVAMQVGSNRVGYYVGRATPFHVDGVPVSGVRSNYLLSGGGRIDATPGAFDVTWPTGERVHVGILSDHLNVSISPAPDQLGRMSGLLGNFDGDPQNDFIVREGASLPTPLSFIDLYNLFAASWRITDQESLFDYEEGESTATFTDLDFPRAPIAAVNLDAAARAAAEATCAAAGVTDPNILEGCILDVGVTEAPAFAEGAAGIPPPEQTLVNTCPAARDLVAYGGSTFQYLITSSAPSGWESPEFDDSGWVTAGGPLGHAPGCGAPGLDTWPAHTGALVRLRFDLADACGLQLGFSLTDEVEAVYLNGQLVLDRSYFHQRCAGFDDLVLNPPRSTWATGENVLAVRLRSNLDVASYDHRVSIGEFAGPAAPECGTSDSSCDGIDDDCDGEVDEDYTARVTSCGHGVCSASGQTSCSLGVESDDCTPLEPPPGDISCLGPNVTRIYFYGYAENGNDGDVGVSGVDVEIAAVGAYASYGTLCTATSGGYGYYACEAALPDPLDVLEVEYRSTLLGAPFDAATISALSLVPGGTNLNYVGRDLLGFPTTLAVQGTVRESGGAVVPYAYVVLSGDVDGGVYADAGGYYRISLPVDAAVTQVDLELTAFRYGLSSEVAAATAVLSPGALAEVDVDLTFVERRLSVRGIIGNSNDPTAGDGLSGVHVVLEHAGAVFCDRTTYPYSSDYNYYCPDLVLTSGGDAEVTFTITSAYGSSAGSFTIFEGEIPPGGQDADYRFDSELAATTLWVNGLITDSTGSGITGGTAGINVVGHLSRTAVTEAGGYYEEYLPVADGVTTVTMEIEGSDGANVEVVSHEVSLVEHAVTAVTQSFSFASDQPGTGRWSFMANNSGGDQVPAIGPDGTIYMPGDRRLYAIAPDGTEVWRYSLATYFGSGSCSPLLAGSVVYAGDSNGVVHAVDVASGTRLWTFQDNLLGFGDVDSLALSSTGTLYAGIGRYVVALDGAGSELWRVELDPDGYETARNLAIGRDGTIYATSYSSLSAFNPDGSRRWRKPGVYGSPAIDDSGTLYTAAHGLISAIDARGQELWSASVEYPASNVAIGPLGRLYVAGGDDLYVFTSTGAEVLTATIAAGLRFSSSTPAVGDDGTVYFVSNESHLVAIDGASGAQVFDFLSPSFYLFEPVVGGGGTVYVLGTDRLYAINAPSAGLAASPWPKLHRDLGSSGAADYVPEPSRLIHASGTVSQALLPGLGLFGFDVEVRDALGLVCTAISGTGGTWECSGPTTVLAEETVEVIAAGLGVETATVSVAIGAGEPGSAVEVSAELYAETTVLVVTGHVADGEGAPLEGAIVELLYGGDLDYERATDATGTPLPYDEGSGAAFATADAAGDYVMYLHYRSEVAEADLALRASAGLTGTRQASRLVTLAPASVQTEVVSFVLVNRGVDWVLNLAPSPGSYLDIGARPVLSGSGGIYLTARVSENFSEYTAQYNRLWAISTSGVMLASVDSQDWRYPSQAVLGADGSVYFTDSTLWAVAGDLSAVLWSYAPNDGADLSRPAVGADGTVYYNASSGGPVSARAVSFDVGLGSPVELWSHDLAEGQLSAPAVDGSGGVFAGVAGLLYGLDPAPSAANRQRFATEVLPTAYWSSSFSPVSSGGGLIAFVDGTVASVSGLDGTLGFSQSLPSYGGGEPAIGPDGTIYVAAWTEVYAIAASGEILWSLDTGMVIEGSPALGPDGEVFVIGDGGLLAVGVPSGAPEVLWSFENPGVYLVGSPAADVDHVYVVGDDGYLYAVSRTGEGSGELPPPPPEEEPPPSARQGRRGAPPPVE